MLNDYAAKEYAEERARLSERHTRKRKETDDYYLPMFDSQKKHFEAELQKVEKDYSTQTEKLKRQRAAELQAEEDNYNDHRANIEGRLDAELKAAEELFQQKMATATAVRDEAWQRMATGWNEVNHFAAKTYSMLRNEGRTLFPTWEEVEQDSRPLSNRVPEGIRCGDMSVDMRALPGGMPTDQRLSPPQELSGLVPAFLPFPDRCSVLLRARDEGRTASVATLQAMMLRFL